MATRKPKLSVVFTPDAQRELKEIYDYDLKHKSPAQAAKYQLFLIAGIEKLAKDYDRGRPFYDFPELLRVVVKPRSGGHGHYVIYEIDHAAQAINILHLYHTRMDVEGRLREEGR